MAGTKTHKAIQLVGAYNVDVTKSTALTERETPSAGDDQVVVNILCRPINPSDILVYSGHYAPFQPTKLPVTIGHEGMGIISEVGKSVKHLSVGQRVVPMTALLKPAVTGQGTWQEYIVVPAASAILVPNSVSDEAASQFFINPWSVYGLLDVLQVPKGGYLIQSAASSAAGRQIIQYAKHLGVKTINLVRRDEQIEELKGVGADEVINYTKGDVVKRVKEITSGNLAYGAIDSAAGDVTKILTQSVRNLGTVLSFGGLAGPTAEVSIRDLIFRDVRVRGFNLSSWCSNLSPQEFSNVASTIMGLMEKKVITPHNGEKFPLHNYVDAIAKSKQSARGGKVFLVNEQV